MEKPKCEFCGATPNPGSPLDATIARLEREIAKRDDLLDTVDGDMAMRCEWWGEDIPKHDRLVMICNEFMQVHHRAKQAEKRVGKLNVALEVAKRMLGTKMEQEMSEAELAFRDAWYAAKDDHFTYPDLARIRALEATVERVSGLPSIFMQDANGTVTAVVTHDRMMEALAADPTTGPAKEDNEED